MSLILKKMKLSSNKKGSFTAEASIIFSVTFLLIALLVYVFIIMYQHTYLQSTVNQVANVGGYYYSNKYGTAESDSNLYWRTLDYQSQNKKNQLNRFTSRKLDKSIIKSSIFLDNSMAQRFLLRQLNIEIQSQHRLPIGSMLEIFGLSPTITVRAEANSNICDNAEFVRNLDLIIDIKKCISQSDNKWVGKDTEVNEVLDKLLKKH